MPTPKKRRMQIRLRQKRRNKRKNVIHSVTARQNDAFIDLVKIVRHGFKATESTIRSKLTNVHLDNKVTREWYPSLIIRAMSLLPQTNGDSYILHFLARVKTAGYHKNMPQEPSRTLHFATPEQIKKISIRLNIHLSAEEKKQRQDFYRTQLPGMRLEFI